MTSPAGASPLDTIRRLASEYQVFGELGRASDDDVWFLARKRGEDSLVALRLERRGVDEWGDPRYEVKLARKVGSDVPTNHGNCSACGARLRSFARFCGRCGADQSEGVRTGTTPDDRAALLAEVRAAAAGAYEVLGEMPQAEGGGMVYFALDRATDELVQLRLRQGVEGMELKETAATITLEHLVTAAPEDALPALGPAPSHRPGTPPLGVTRPPLASDLPGPAPVPSIRIRAAGPAPEPGQPASAAAPSRPSERERRLGYAVIALGVVVIIETGLLLFS